MLSQSSCSPTPQSHLPAPPRRRLPPHVTSPPGRRSHERHQRHHCVQPPCPSPLLSPLPSVAPLRLTEHHSLRPCPLFVLKESHFGARVIHIIISRVPLSLALDLALPLPSVACLV